jgi:hypothetical protein
MHRIFALMTLAILSCSSLNAAAKIDKRLYTAKTAFVMPMDDLGDDKPVATCFAEHLAKQTSIQPTEDRASADIVIKVKAHLPGQAARHALGAMGGRPSGHLFAEAGDGTKLWDDGAKLGSGWSASAGIFIQGNQTTECAMADELIDALRNAMRKARDSK